MLQEVSGGRLIAFILAGESRGENGMENATVGVVPFPMAMIRLLMNMDQRDGQRSHRQPPNQQQPQQRGTGEKTIHGNHGSTGTPDGQRQRLTRRAGL